MKVVFLDIDGVLNTGKNYSEYLAAMSESEKRVGLRRPLQLHVELLFDKDNVGALNAIIEQTHAKIVVSSSWRCYYDGKGANPPFEKLVDTLKRVGVGGEIIGKTPSLLPPKMSMSVYRGNEIQAWLDGHKRVSKFVILDDDNDMVHLTPALVKTDGGLGLTLRDASRAIDKLGRTQLRAR